MLLIAVGEDRGFRVDAPIDRQLRIVPANAALVNGRVTGRDFIENLGVRLERHEAMREADRDENLLPVFGAEDDLHMSAEGWGGFSDIDGDVEEGAADDADELVLGHRSDLIMQAAQHAALR